MEKIAAYIRGVSLADMEAQLDELHYNQLLGEGRPGEIKSPQERYDTAFTLNFVKGLIRVVKKETKKRERKKRERKSAA